MTTRQHNPMHFPIKASATMNSPVVLGRGSFELIEAKDDQTSAVKAFKMVAYTGSLMRVGAYFDPVVVDLSGQISVRSGQLPILLNHNHNVPIGHAEASGVRISASGIELDGSMSGVGTPEADRVVAMARNGYKWQASIGLNPTRSERVASGAVVNVNGQDVQGPAWIVRAGELYEISVVAVGADRRATTTVAAQSAGARDMTFEQWLTANNHDRAALSASQLATLEAEFEASRKPEGNKPETPKPSATTIPAPGAPVTGAADPLPIEAAIKARREAEAAEADRIDSVRKLCAKHRVPGIEAKAIREGWDADRAELEILRANASISASVGSGAGGRSAERLDKDQVALAASLGIRALTEEQVVAQCGGAGKVADAVIAASKDMTSIQQIAIEGMRHLGIDTGHGSYHSRIQASIGSHELGNVLSAVINKSLVGSYNQVAVFAPEIAETVDLPNFYANTGVHLEGGQLFKKVGTSGVIDKGQLKDSGYNLQAEVYADSLALTRKQLINDDTASFASIPRIFGRGAAGRINRAMTDLIEGGVNNVFFVTGNNNYFTGASGALSVSALETALGNFLAQVGKDSAPIGLMPKKLLVPSALYATALSIYQSEMIVSGSTTSKPATNIFRNMFKPVLASELSVATSWFLTSDPNEMPAFRLGFVGGVRVPQIKLMTEIAGVDGWQWDATLDFGVGFGDPKCAQYNKGAA